jgi:hypothetical protein
MRAVKFALDLGQVQVVGVDLLLQRRKVALVGFQREQVEQTVELVGDVGPHLREDVLHGIGDHRLVAQVAAVVVVVFQPRPPLLVGHW